MALNFSYNVVMGGFNAVGAASRWLFPETEEPELTEEEKQQEEKKKKSMCTFCSEVSFLVLV